ncbi:MAG: hypothetical protein O3C57_05020 [Verrucomicrobia bacterium]|nr:hypothetical protein [Verrucomicrobiota bacterium]
MLTSVFVLCTGLIANMASYAKLKDASASLLSRQQSTSQLRQLLEKSGTMTAQLSTLDMLTKLPIIPLDEVFRTTFVEETVAEFSPAEIRDLRSTTPVGWTLMRKELSFVDVPLPALMRFIKTAEKTTPPWRVDKVQLVASATKPGYARAVLEMSSASQTP